MTLDRLVAAVLALVCAGLLLRGCSASRDLAAATGQLDSLRTEELAARAEAAGWEQRLVRETSDLAGDLEDAGLENEQLRAAVDSLVRQAEVLGGRVAVLAEMYADAAGQIAAQDAVLHASGPSGTLPDSVTGHVDDGLLSASVTATLDPPTVAIPEYLVRLGLVLGVTEAADGRALLTARPTDPRIRVSYGRTYWQPPPPERYCSVGTKITWAGYGAGGAGLVGLIARLLGAP